MSEEETDAVADVGILGITIPAQSVAPTYEARLSILFLRVEITRDLSSLFPTSHYVIVERMPAGYDLG